MSWSHRARTALLAPLALATASCEQVYSAADVSMDRTDDLGVPRIAYHVPPWQNAVNAWQLPPGGPWAAYEKFTLLSALDDEGGDWELPDVHAIPEVRYAKLAADVIARAGLPRDAAWFVDLRGAASVAFAHQLNLASPIRLAPVPTFNNWPDEYELVPAEETLAAMVDMPPPRAFDPAARPMFLLDAWRLAYKETEVDDEMTDNRYALGRGDFPSANALLAQGIRRIVYVVGGSREGVHEEDDLNNLFRDYEEHGIEIGVVGIGDLLALPDAWEWDDRPPGVGVPFSSGLWGRWRFHPAVRLLCTESPYFLQLARGGWGGAFALPGGGGVVHFGHGGG